MVSTTTLTVTSRSSAYRRSRALSLALVATTIPLLSLPPEVTLDVFELAILENTPSTLAVVSKAIHAFINTILYRTVVLTSLRDVELFHRTVTSKRSAFLASHVRALAITWSPGFSQGTAHSLIEDIIIACRGARTLVLPSLYKSLAFPSFVEDRLFKAGHEVAGGDGLFSLILQSFQFQDHAGVGTPYSVPINTFRSITHLRICEPSDEWHSPIDILSSFGTLPNLTHLQLSRRAEANESNDIAFVDDVRCILAQRPMMKMLVVSIFSQSWRCADSVVASHIWELLQEVIDSDARIFRLVGEYEGWKKDWDRSFVVRPMPAGDFWGVARQEARNAATLEAADENTVA